MRFVKNEWIKLWSQRSTWIMLGLLLVAVIGFLGLNNYFGDASGTAEERRVANEKTVKMYEDLLQDETDEVYRAEFEQSIATAQYRIKHDLPSEGAITALEGIDLTISITIAIVTIFTLVVGASIVSSEFATGTIKMLLTRPSARWKILLSKLVATLLYGLALMVVSLLVGIVTSYILFDSSTPIRIIAENGQMFEQAIEFQFAEQLLLSAASIFMTVLFAFMLGTVFSSSTLAVSLALGIMFFGSLITSYLAQYDFTKYIWIANDLAQFVGGGTPIIAETTLSFAVMVNVIYAIIFLTITFTNFMRRDITA